MTIKTYAYLSFALTLVAGLFVGSMALAQNAATASVGIKIAPTLIQENVDPGSSLSEQITVSNLSNVSQTYQVGVQNINGISDAGQPIFAAPGEQTNFDVSTWFTFPDNTITIAPGDTVTVPFTIWVPKSATPGGHFAGITLDLKADKPTTNGSGIGFEVASIVALQVSGQTTDLVKIIEFSTDKLLYGSTPVTFTTKIENGGNTLQRPRGPIDITDMTGKHVGTVIMNDAAGATIPGSTRQFTAQWTDSGFHIGRYDAVMSLNYGSNGANNTVSATVSFWIVPFRIIGPIVGGILLFFILLVGGTRWYIRRKLSGIARTTQEVRGSRGMSLGVMTVVSLVVALALLAAVFFLFS